MPKRIIGELHPRYSFILNPHAELRLSKCPKCQQPTHLRKFALFIHVDGWGSIALGKTYRYCSRCELIMVHRDELEEQLAHSLTQIASEAIGNEYVVLGTIEKKTWQEGLRGKGKRPAAMLQHVAEFKNVYEPKYEPGGWYPS
ncbi:MAG TPA: hypothetical protein VII23_09880 [Terriglobales bacterium]